MSDAWWQKSRTEMFIQVAWHLGSECSLTEAWILCWLWRMSRRDSTKRCVPWMVSKTMIFLVPQSQAVKDTFWNWNRAVNFFEHVCPGAGQLSEKKEKTTWMLGDLICNQWTCWRGIYNRYITPKQMWNLKMIISKIGICSSIFRS